MRGGHRVGVSVGAHDVRAVLVRRGALVATSNAVRGDDLGTSLVQAVRALPLPRWPRPSITVAVGPSLASTKRVAGLPPVRDRDALAALLRANAERFFLMPAGVGVVGSVVPAGANEAWTTAYAPEIVDAARDAAGALGIARVALVPAAAVLVHALRERTHDRLALRDGAQVVEVGYAAGELAELRPVLHSTAPDRGALVAALEAKPDAWELASAYAAAVRGPHDRLALRLRDAGGESQQPRRTRRTAVAAAACALASVACAVAPALAAARAERVAANRLAALAPLHARAVASERALRDAGRDLAAVEGFLGARPPAVAMLAALGRALPDGSAIAEVRLDGASVRLTVLAPRAAAVLAALAQAPSVASPEIVGAVAREQVGVEQMERVAIRFTVRSVEAAP